MNRKTKKLILAIELVVLVLLSGFAASTYVVNISSEKSPASLKKNEKSNDFIPDDPYDEMKGQGLEGENIPPIATLFAIPVSGTPPLFVNFVGNGIDKDGEIVSYEWNFSENIGSFELYTDEKYALRIYCIPGVYYVGFTVIDDNGANDTATIPIIVSNIRTAVSALRNTKNNNRLSYKPAMLSDKKNLKVIDLNGVMWTTGPISNRIAKINFIDGSADEIKEIKEVLNKPKLNSLPFGVIEVSNLTFSVTYKRRIFFPWPSYIYSTQILSPIEDKFIMNKKHTITVKNLEGYFTSMINFPMRPCRFTFIGFYELFSIN